LKLEINMADCPIMISIMSYSWATSHDLWETQLEENRQKYADMKEELLLNQLTAIQVIMGQLSLDIIFSLSL
jgi:hypothetical protein